MHSVYFGSWNLSRLCNYACRYEELKRQLSEAQEAAQLEDEEAELARAENMLARLTSPALAAAGRLAGPRLARESMSGSAGPVVSHSVSLR